MEGNRTRTGHPSSRFSSVSRGGPSLLVPGCGGSKPPFRPVTATARKHLGKNRRPQCRRRELPQRANSVCALAAGRVADAEGNVSLLQLTKCGLNLIYAGSGDEAKPQCQNCTAKGFACKYPSKVTFVSIVHASNQQSDGTGATYSTIRFVDETPATPSLQESGTVAHEQTPAENHVESLELLPGLSRPTAHLPSNSALPAVRARRQVAFTALSDSGHDPETGLLRHYCYALAPWIDVGDPGRAFGLEFLILGRRVRPLLAAILALAAGQRSLVVPTYAADDLARSLRFREEAENGLPLQSTAVQRVGNVFFMLHDFFSSRPSQWKALVTGYTNAPGGLGCLSAADGELNEPSLWVTLRIDLAASIISSEPPQMLIPALVSALDPSSTKQVYQHILLLLAHTLSFIFGSSTAYLEGLGQVGTVPALNPVSQWNYLWTECRRWYLNRPLQVQPVLDVRAAHADEIDPQNASSFPILVYTTPLALVANAVYHVASFLLLARKPRFVKTLTGPKCLSSSIWHAQSIAGIATSNDTVEQWDPILIAGLLLIAKDMTHHLQQSAVLNQLQRITELTGIHLDDEIESLQSQWRVSRYEESIA
ncbi:uncharacterized protein AFUA_4G14660 [Aspergillus fumigatus Af293]|uniref:Zn(2)-C6 fungal-type domain-containing protein n=1 Tax=Aspergillus fumigatus (strain ATCC MYA-4609 / CBS 101355 / FGSC A1100 / Af293) TaxID=330879 RepID=Q4WR05_ASPFU|nr:conserved hypothetical protein [Aspergillus fumigatus Af293]EAL89329.1 conserved hypothetical protein [Aspergillus fumigatus Af293]